MITSSVLGRVIFRSQTRNWSPEISELSDAIGYNSDEGPLIGQFASSVNAPIEDAINIGIVLSGAENPQQDRILEISI